MHLSSASEGFGSAEHVLHQLLFVDDDRRGRETEHGIRLSGIFDGRDRTYVLGRRPIADKFLLRLYFEEAEKWNMRGWSENSVSSRVDTLSEANARRKPHMTGFFLVLRKRRGRTDST